MKAFTKISAKDRHMQIVQARVIAVAEKVVRVEVFGVETSTFVISNPRLPMLC